jgi:protein involved in polysaccharide export with SLBB domain
MTLRAQRLAVLVWLILTISLTSCTSAPDKRALQYLNQSGFGNRYTGNAEEQNYLTIGDTLRIEDVFHPELNGSAVVDIDGTVVLPEVGPVHIAGQTRSELEAFLMEKYAPYYEQLDITVTLQTRGKIYFVFGEVQIEGEQPFPGDLTLFQAVMKAGPNKNTANLGRVRLIRADPRDPFVQTFNVNDLLKSGDSTFNVHVQEYDIVFVPPTILAKLGYFLSDLIFPVTEVARQLTGAIFLFIGGGRGVGRRNNSPVF